MGEDLKGITLNGKPLVSKDLSSFESNEIQSVVREEIKEMKSCIPSRTFVAEYKPEIKDFHSKSKKLSDEEIRRQYGLLLKPFKTSIENALWMIINKGPVNFKEICTTLKKPERKFSGHFSVIVRLLDDYIMKKKIKHNGKNIYLYELYEVFKEDELINPYTLSLIFKKRYTEYRKKKREEKVEKIANFHKKVANFYKKVDKEKENISFTLTGKDFNIYVSGRIEIIFRIEGEKDDE